MIQNKTVGLPNFFSSYRLTDGSLVNVNILDTGGQEQYKSLNEQYYHKADCCLLVYDVTNRKSFEECKDYYNKNLIEKCKKNVKVILLGNKTDLKDKRVVLPEEGNGLALENDYMFMETSCLNNTNVSNAFETLIELTNIEAKKNKQNNIQLDPKKMTTQKHSFVHHPNNLIKFLLKENFKLKLYLIWHQKKK